MSVNKIGSAAAAGTFAIGGDLVVNRLGYGAMRITGAGVWGPPADKAGALATLRRTAELGSQPDRYSGLVWADVSEELIAEALFPYPAGAGYCNQGRMGEGGTGTVDAQCESEKHLTEAVEGSLKRLRLERIDVYQLHVPDPAVSFEASVGTLAKLREQGKIRHVALSNVTREHVERARAIVPIVSVQNRYSFADRESDFYRGPLREAWDRVYAVGSAGTDERGERGPDEGGRGSEGDSDAGGAMAWLLKRSKVILPIPGDLVGEASGGERCRGESSVARRRRMSRSRALSYPPASLRG